jgi:hypothetical protein
MAEASNLDVFPVPRCPEAQVVQVVQVVQGARRLKSNAGQAQRGVLTHPNWTKTK